MSRKSVEDDEKLEDVIRREDGLVRHWMFLNGETFRLFSALTAAIAAVLWCFLYFLGYGQSILGIVLLVLASLSLFVWWALVRELQKYAESGWRKDKHPAERDRVEIRIAIGLWLFIALSICAIFLGRWLHEH